jgi:Rod binding domain-containing protein
MTGIGNHFDAAMAHVPVQSSTAVGGDAIGKKPSPEDVREAFTQFVGQTFFGQMMKAMRSTVGKPAYFHGGRGEEVFQSQLDQTLAEHMTDASAEQFADPMFRLQFPHLADKVGASTATGASLDLSGLAALSRR